MATLKVEEGGSPGQSLDLLGERIVLGRHPSCQIVLDNSAVSRNHAQILESHGQYFIEDLRSRNGTTVNGHVVEGRVPLHDEDRIGICDVIFSFHVGIVGLPHRQMERTRSAIEPRSTPAPYDKFTPTPAEIVIPLESDFNLNDQSSIISSVNVSALSDLRLEVKPEVKLRAILEITTSLGKTLQVDKLLPKILDSLLRIFPAADRGVILLKASETDRLQVKCVRLRDDEKNQSVPISMTIVNHALQTKQAFLSEDAIGDDRLSASESVASLRIRSVMCAPLVTPSGDALGVIQIDTLNSRFRFTQEDLDLLVAIAAQAAMAVDNAHLHEEGLRRRDLERDLEFATQVQLGFLPTERPKLADYQFYDYYEAAYRVGGDFFDYVTLPDGRLAITIGDVAGKGVPAALLMARLYSMARYSLLTSKTPAEAVTSLNAAISSSGLGHRFITFAQIVLDPQEHTATIVNAGHLPPLLFRPGAPTQMVGNEASGLPLGVTFDFEYRQMSLSLEPGQGLLLYTDGVTESMNAQKEIFGMQRLVSFLTENAGAVDQVGEKLVEDVEEFCGGLPQRDDMCLVCFRRIN